jgi:transcriptional regulator with XRE-family HTH domain
MADLKYAPVPHEHKSFLDKARSRKGFQEAYDALELEYQVAGQMLKARSRAGLTQDAVAERMGTTKSAVSRLKSAGKHTPSLATLERYARAVGCELQVKLVRRKVTPRTELDQLVGIAKGVRVNAIRDRKDRY